MKLPIFSITGVTPLKPLLISITVSALSLERTAAKPDGIGVGDQHSDAHRHQVLWSLRKCGTAELRFYGSPRLRSYGISQFHVGQHNDSRYR